jgi:hypothetical protein
MTGPDLAELEASRRTSLLDLLERRRGGIEQAMWQAPTITIAGQAFLLQVLTTPDVRQGARTVVMAAGVMACTAAVLSLLRLRAREVQYAEAVAVYSRWHVPDVRPPALPAERPGGVPPAARWWWPRGHVLWSIALVLFAAADVVAWHWR